MKHFLIFLFAFVYFNIQNVLAQKVNWEINAGGNYTTLVNSSNQFPARLGFYLGIEKAIYLSDKFSINPSLNFSVRRFRAISTIQYKGYEVGIPNDMDTLHSNNLITSGYFNLPITLQCKVIKKLSFSIGPEFSMKLFEKDQVNESLGGNLNLLDPYESFSSVGYMNNNINFLEISATVGLEYKLSNKMVANFYLNYEIASSRTPKYFASVFTRPYEGTHELWIQLGIGYLINRINK